MILLERPFSRQTFLITNLEAIDQVCSFNLHLISIRILDSDCFIGRREVHRCFEIFVRKVCNNSSIWEALPNHSRLIVISEEKSWTKVKVIAFDSDVELTPLWQFEVSCSFNFEFSWLKLSKQLSLFDS